VPPCGLHNQRLQDNGQSQHSLSCAAYCT
jgi:hypothetical protein